MNNVTKRRRPKIWVKNREVEGILITCYKKKITQAFLFHHGEELISSGPRHILLAGTASMYSVLQEVWHPRSRRHHGIILICFGEKFNVPFLHMAEPMKNLTMCTNALFNNAREHVGLVRTGTLG
jgi:hypothetical protein